MCVIFAGANVCVCAFFQFPFPCIRHTKRTHAPTHHTNSPALVAFRKQKRESKEKKRFSNGRTDLGGGKTLLGQLDNVLNDILRGVHVAEPLYEGDKEERERERECVCVCVCVCV